MRKSVKALAAGSVATLALVVSPLVAIADDPTDEATVNPEATGDVAAEAQPAEEVAPKEGDVVTLDLYNMTDIHGHIEKATDRDGNYTEAGLASVACYVNKAKTENANSVFTLLGDNIGASPFTSGSQNDNPTIAALNESGVFASAIGNHEFDKGVQAFRDRLKGTEDFTKIEFPYLVSNIIDEATGKPFLDPYEIWSSPSGVTVGFIAGIEDDAPTKVAPGTFDGFRFDNAAETINKYAADLKDGDPANGEADIVVALYDNDAKQSAARMSSDVDALMGGDTHVPYYFDELEGKDGNMIPVTASGSFTNNLANISLQYDKAKGEIVSAKAIQIPASKLVECGDDPAVKTVIDEAVAAAEEAKSEVVIETENAFYRGIQEVVRDGETTVGENRGTESTLGGLVADAMKDSFKDLNGDPIDIGIINAGGLRADLVPTDGKITVGDVFAVAPFSNEVGYVKMTGAQFKTLLEQQWKVIGDKSTRPMLKLGLSKNVTYTYDPSREMGDRITSILLGGQPINPEAVYTVGSVTFLLAGGDSFDVLKDESIAPTLTTISEGLDREWIQKYLEANPEVAPRSAVSSVGVTAEATEEGASVSLRGLSFTHEGEFMPDSVKLTVGDVTRTVELNNTLLDENAANMDAIVTTDGVGRTDEPALFTTEELCVDKQHDTFMPITVEAEDGTILVASNSGLGVTVDCGVVPEEPTEEPSEELTVANPVAPQFVNPSAADPASCTVKPYATVTDVEGVVYTVTVDGKELTANAEGKFVYDYGKKIVVKAAPAEGYQFADDADTEWSWTATLSDKCSTSTPSGNGSLAQTGVNTLAGLAGAIVLLGAGSALVIARRKNA